MVPVEVWEMAMQKEASEMKKVVFRFIKDEAGATAIEYALLSSFISIAIVATTAEVGNALTNSFSNVANNL